MSKHGGIGNLAEFAARVGQAPEAEPTIAEELVAIMWAIKGTPEEIKANLPKLREQMPNYQSHLEALAEGVPADDVFPRNFNGSKRQR